jgi:hypothetical protein
VYTFSVVTPSSITQFGPAGCRPKHTRSGKVTPTGLLGQQPTDGVCNALDRCQQSVLFEASPTPAERADMFTRGRKKDQPGSRFDPWLLSARLTPLIHDTQDNLSDVHLPAAANTSSKAAWRAADSPSSPPSCQSSAGQTHKITKLPCDLLQVWIIAGYLLMHFSPGYRPLHLAAGCSSNVI